MHDTILKPLNGKAMSVAEELIAHLNTVNFPDWQHRRMPHAMTLQASD